METANSSYSFFACTNSRCKLRFPLEAELFDGRYCPRCGAPLERQEAGIPALKPPAARKPGFELIGALDNIRSAHNVGAIFRTADGAGLSELILGGITPTPTNSHRSVKLPWEQKKTSSGVIAPIFQMHWLNSKPTNAGSSRWSTHLTLVICRYSNTLAPCLSRWPWSSAANLPGSTLPSCKLRIRFCIYRWPRKKTR